MGKRLMSAGGNITPASTSTRPEIDLLHRPMRARKLHVLDREFRAKSHELSLSEKGRDPVGSHLS